MYKLFEVLGRVTISGHWRPYWMSMGDNDGQMIFGDLGALKLSDICLTGEENPEKKPHPGNLSRPGIEPGPAAWQARMLPLASQRWTIHTVKKRQHRIKYNHSPRIQIKIPDPAANRTQAAALEGKDYQPLHGDGLVLFH